MKDLETRHRWRERSEDGLGAFLAFAACLIVLSVMRQWFFALLLSFIFLVAALLPVVGERKNRDEDEES